MDIIIVRDIVEAASLSGEGTLNIYAVKTAYFGVTSFLGGLYQSHPRIDANKVIELYEQFTDSFYVYGCMFVAYNDRLDIDIYICINGDFIGSWLEMHDNKKYLDNTVPEPPSYKNLI